MAEQIIMKTCRICKQTKPLSEFYKDKHRKDGHRSNCKICCSKYQKSDKGKVVQKRYEQSEKNKTNKKTYQATEKSRKSHRIAIFKYDHSNKGRICQSRHRRTDIFKNTQSKYRKYNFQKLKARSSVNVAIKKGELPRPNTLLCNYCPNQAEDYHHHKGYAPEYWLDVIPVCKKCHKKLS